MRPRFIEAEFSSAEREHKPKKILEIGSGGKSYYEIFDLEVPPKGSQEFFLDIHDEYVKKMKRATRSRHKHFIIADGQKLPFPTDSMDAVYLTNILNSVVESYIAEAKALRGGEDGVAVFDTSYFKMKPPTVKQQQDAKSIGIEYANHFATIDRIVRDARRVLKKDGKLFVVQGPTSVYPESDKKTYEFILKRLESDPRFEFVEAKFKKPPK